MNYKVEEILEKKFHDAGGRVGAVLGIEISTRFSKEALLGAMLIIIEQNKSLMTGIREEANPDKAIKRVIGSGHSIMGGLGE
jgi:hypothetical protein